MRLQETPIHYTVNLKQLHCDVLIRTDYEIPRQLILQQQHYLQLMRAGWCERLVSKGPVTFGKCWRLR